MNRVVVTGGASGIGKYLALGFSKKGYEVFVLDIKKPALMKKIFIHLKWIYAMKKKYTIVLKR